MDVAYIVSIIMFLLLLTIMQKRLLLLEKMPSYMETEFWPCIILRW